MKKVRISDVTLTYAELSFKEKLEIARLLDKTGADVVNFGKIVDDKVDLLAIRTLGQIFTSAAFSCTVGSSREEIESVAKALASAKKPRIVVSLPVSPVQMEYVCAKKPADMINLISDSVAYAASLCADVEFEAVDASRAESGFLASAISAAISSGARTVTLCDTSGDCLPREFGEFVKNTVASVENISGVTVSVCCFDKFRCASASLFEAIASGASEVRVSALGKSLPGADSFAEIVSTKGEELGVSSELNIMNLSRICESIRSIVNTHKSGTVFDNRVGGSSQSTSLGEDTDLPTLRAAVEDLGYELSDEDVVKVYDAFLQIAAKKLVTARDLDAIVATAALQVPPVYRMASFVINSGNIIGSTANVVLEKDGKKLNGLSMGNGPVDAAFLALEQITGHHFELDDFQIQALTEGREAVGEAIVRLRANGKLYSGRGVSTDIVGASLRAYVSALNKIVYDENF